MFRTLPFLLLFAAPASAQNPRVALRRAVKPSVIGRGGTGGTGHRLPVVRRYSLRLLDHDGCL